MLFRSVDGWIDWNMVLNKQGGPNWFENWCVAPVIVDEKKDEVYFTPIYYTMAHFSKFIRPGAKRIGFEKTDDQLMVTAAENPDGTIAVVLFNGGESKKDFELILGEASRSITMGPQAIQTVVVQATKTN